MTGEGKIQGAIGYIRRWQSHNHSAMVVCDALESLQAEQQGRAAFSLGQGFGVGREKAAQLAEIECCDECARIVPNNIRKIGEDES